MSSVNWVRHGERQCVSDKEKVEGRVLLGEAWRRNDIEESMSNRCALKEGKNTPQSCSHGERLFLSLRVKTLLGREIALTEMK
jgi:hypothetical protein